MTHTKVDRHFLLEKSISVIDLSVKDKFKKLVRHFQK